MAKELLIKNGKVFDPTNNIDGVIGDISISDGKIVANVSDKAKTIDAHGMAVLPGGVDIHCHIAGPKVNLARKLLPEDHRLDPHPSTMTKLTKSHRITVIL